jgi:membrane-bound lytic murein transglycosylase F
MLKKTLLTFAFLTILTAYGYDPRSHAPAPGDFSGVTPRIGVAAALAANRPTISVYDHLMRGISEPEGHDWRLMSAIAYHESRFTPDIVSPRGARGLMQIMPSVARQFGVPVERIGDVETNIYLANRLLSEIRRSLRLPAGIAERDRMRFLLAAYNGGIGHVRDARRLAAAYGDDPDSWEAVARYLRLKAAPEYYEHEAVRCGRFTGGEQTLAYVRDVMGRYDKYCRTVGR